LEKQYYIGLMSGTSLDGIDAVVADFSSTAPTLCSHSHTPFPSPLKKQLADLCQAGFDGVHRMGEADVALGRFFAETVNALLKKSKFSYDDITAIGSHGQTIRHYPKGAHPYTCQIGDPNIIAAETHITTIADFRRRDMAHGGQGAPLVPAFHQAVFHSSDKNRAIVNIGGMANVSILPKEKNKPVIGFDTGPGNTLLDAWHQQHHDAAFDKNGEWASTGTVDSTLLNTLLQDPYFKQLPPKSTGREYFNLNWLRTFLKNSSLPPEDIQATLTALTAESILSCGLETHAIEEIYLCGGGVYNHTLMNRLQQKSPCSVFSTKTLGIPPDWIEALAFAWLAKQTFSHQTGNLREVTGARNTAVLGGIYFA
jgi:anhydro-N-acetylmuramic acid kinase